MRGMKRFGVSVLLVVGLAFPAQAETLTDALIAAYRNSHLLEQNQALLRAADEDVAIAVSALRPIISFSAGYQHNIAQFSGFGVTSDGTPGLLRNVSESNTSSYGLTMEMTLWDGGRSQLGIEVAKESVLATRQGLVNIEQQVLISAVQSYVNVKLASEIVFLRQSNVRVIGQELQAAKDRFEVGEYTRTDVAIAEASLASARAQLAAAEGDLMVARESYKLAVGHYPEAISTLPKAPTLSETLELAQSVALKNHPALRRAQHEVTIAQLNSERAKRNGKPTIRLSGSVTDPEGSYSFGGSPGQSNGLSATGTLSFNKTLYSGGQIAALYRKALAQQEASQAGLLQTSMQVEEGVGNAWASVLVATAQIEATNRQIEAAQVAFDGLREEAKLGARTSLDVLDAEQDLLDARVQRATAEAQRYLSTYSLLQSMGLLTVEHLNLGIPTYDPAAYYRAVKDAPVHTVQGKKLDRILKSISQPD
ncbi:TolC family outer membrane protein [Neogemmobacter tilapiae]|uniref:Transporter n=1 Tax=Neogemmobacter tilapiae TaxID=875041 RepID=A0A918WIL3_9RHOB|nr:TolC family outer membrane protein [Gemmobacter tilapiae]GHC46851.1 transporter [Gemmobacter tilapiae]